MRSPIGGSPGAAGSDGNASREVNPEGAGARIGSTAGVGTLASALAERESLLGHCVHCGFCLPVCPTYRELGDEADSPRGRLHLMRAVVEGRLDPAADAFQRHMDRCLGCRACETVCPSGVEYGHLLERARAVAVEARPVGFMTRALLWTMATPLPGALFGLFGRMLRATGLPAMVARALPSNGFHGIRGRARLGMGMLAASAPPRFPSVGRASPSRASRAPGAPTDAVPASTTTVATPAPPLAPPPAITPRGRVALLTGCVQDQLFGRVNDATRLVLRVNGWEVVDVPNQGCCGALHAHAGELAGARRLIRANLEAFGALLDGPEAVDFIVVNAAGCGALMRELPELVEGDTARAVAERARDISEVLAGDGRLPVEGAPLPSRVAYDAPCHLMHAQRVVEPPRALLGAIPGLEILPLRDADRCCGGAGIYGITHPELGGRIGGGKVDAILETGCDIVATGNPGCQMQIGAGLRIAGHEIPVVHPVELLAESYRRQEKGVR